MMHRNKSVNQHQFAMVPRADIPRARFQMQMGHKTTFDSGFLIPIFCEEVLPGDSWRVNMTAFARLATPIFPIMDNVYLDSFFFFVPNRLVWTNWVKFMGEQEDPGDSTSFAVPQVVCPAGGWDIGSMFDYFGLPTVGQVEASSTVSVNALPLRAYNLIYNEWFRDENLQNSRTVNKGDGPDDPAAYLLRRRGKRHDYFTSALPWPQKGEAVPVPISGNAPVYTAETAVLSGSQFPLKMYESVTGAPLPTNSYYMGVDADSGNTIAKGTNSTVSTTLAPYNLYADLTEATNVTINALRQSFQIQKLLERDARGGTRYTEIIRSHFGVISPDARLQRPEYLGGGSTPVVVNPVAQTSATTASGTDTPLGNLAAVGTALGRHGFTQSFTEHGYVIGLISARADLSYQQGLRRHWSRQTRYDYYFPAFAMLGEQAVLSKEIYCTGEAGDADVFGYQERWAEYRYTPSMITGLFRSTAAGSLDAWHLAQQFTTRPTLGTTFISETPPMQRILAVGEEADGAEFIFDSVFDIAASRPLPLFSVPGLIDHF